MTMPNPYESPNSSSNDWLLEYHLPSDLFEEKQQNSPTSVLHQQSVISSMSDGGTCSSPTTSETFSFSDQLDLPGLSTYGGNHQTLFTSSTSNDFNLQLRSHLPAYSSISNYRDNYMLNTQQPGNSFMPNEFFGQSPYFLTTSQPEFISPVHYCSQDFKLISVRNCTTFFIENNNQEISGYVSQHECGFSHPLFEIFKKKKNEISCSFLLSSGITWWECNP